MILKSITKKRSKVLLNLDNNETIEILYEVYLKSNIIKGEELNRESIDKIIRLNELTTIRNSAFRYLSFRNHTKEELRTKLLRKGFNDIFLEEVLVELEEKEYLDDRKFAELFVISRIEKKRNGIVKIRSELKKKGVTDKIISDLLNDEYDNPLHFENALYLAEKKIRSISGIENFDTTKIKSRLYNYLKNRGFTSDIIYSVFEKLKII